uniref:Kinetochore scaffold 1 n=1 Tax=Xenopus tropicalis TaxID=8364 RepID=A0A6I8S461_XENTR
MRPYTYVCMYVRERSVINSIILKVPRSPLKDLGNGNVLHQVCVHVNYTCHSRVVIQIHFGNLSNSSQVTTPSNQIYIFLFVGMDTLLHGPIQTPAPQSEWDCADHEKTVFFSCDNDMEMTASNTIHIDAFLEEKINKIDVTSFLASLKSQDDDSCQNVKLNPSTSSDFPSAAESAVPTKINFKDFLTGLKTEKQTIYPFRGCDKENFFPFSIASENSGRELFSTFTQRQEDKENLTQIFTEQDEGLDMTKCHTTNITAFVPVTKQEFPFQFEPNALNIPKAFLSHEHLQDGFKLNKPESVSKNQTVLFEDDMDMTQSHSICLENVLSKPKSGGNAQSLNNFSDKTVVFTDSNEMEFTQNHTVAINTNTGAGDSVWQKSNLLITERNFVSSDDSMDLTKCHTVAIDGKSMESSCAPTSTSLPATVEWHNGISGSTSSSTYFSKSLPKQNQDLSLPFYLGAEKTVTFDDEDMDLNTTNTAHIMFGLGPNTSIRRKSIPVVPTSHLFIMNDKTVVSNQDMDLTQCVTTVLDTDSCYGLQGSNEACSSSSSEPKKSLIVSKSSVLPKPTNSSDQHKSSHFKEDQYTNDIISSDGSSKSMLSAVADKTLLFSCNQDDMEITKSHTVAIDKFLQEHNSTKIPENVPKDKTVKPGGLRLSSFSKHILFPEASHDVELTKRHPADEKLGQKEKELCQPSSDHQQNAPIFSKNETVEDMLMGGMNTNFKSIVGTFPSVHNKTILAMENMDITEISKSAFKDTFLGGKFPVDEVKTSIAARDKTILFSCEQEDMDMTRSHTVTIERKDLCKGSKHDLNLHMTNNVSTFSSELDFTKSHGAIENKVSVADECSKLVSNRKSTGKAMISDCVQNTGLYLQSVNRNVPLSRFSEEQTAFSPSKDYMDFTQSCTVAIENNLPEGLKTAKTTSQEFDFYQSKSTASDKTVEDDMELTKSHTMVISAKCADELHSQFAAFKSNTDAGFGEDDMDITKSNTVFINEIPDISKGLAKPYFLKRESVAGPKSSFLANEKTIHIEGDMEMTTGNIGLLLHDAVVPTRVNKAEVDKTVVFLCEQDNMDLTLSHTVAIESKGLCELNSDVRNKSGHFSKQNPLPLNKTVHMVEDDMELTRSHTMVINEQPDGLYNQSNPANKSNYDDMGITKSDTVFINETKTSKEQVDPSLLKKINANKNSELRRSYFSDKSIHLVGDMEMTDANAGLLINDTQVPVQRKSIGLPYDKTLVFSCETEHMDLTMSHTVAIESKGIYEAAEALNPNGKSKSDNCSELPSVSMNKNTVLLEDDMELTKSLTMVIKKSDPSNYTLKSNYGPGFEQDDMDITRSATVFIDNMPVNQQSKGQINLFVKRQSVGLKGSNFVYDRTVHLDGNMELTNAGTGLLISETNVPTAKNTLEACNDKTMVFSNEQDNMDLTVSNTVAIENKDFCEGTKTPNIRISENHARYPSVPVNKTCTMFAEDMEMTKSHSMVIEQKTALLDVHNQCAVKQSFVNLVSEADAMDITKSNTVFIDNHLDGFGKTPLNSRKQDFSNEHLHGDMKARMNGKTGRLSSANVMSHIAAAENKEMGNSDLHTDRLQNYVDTCSAPACKTIVFSRVEDDMDLTKSHTMVIDERNILKGENQSSRQQGQIFTANSDKTVAFSSDDMDFTLSHSARLEKGIFELAQQEEMINILSKTQKGNILELQRPFLNKHATVNFPMHEGDVELAKCHAVDVEVDKQTPSTALIKQDMETETSKASSMKSLEKGVMSDANMNLGNITSCALTKYSVGEDKTAISVCNLSEMDMTTSHTVAIENKMEDLQNPVISSSSQKVVVPGMGEKNSNGMVFCAAAYTSTHMDQCTLDGKNKQQNNQVVAGNQSDFGCDTNIYGGVSSLKPADHITHACGNNEGPVSKDETGIPYKDTVDDKTMKKARPKSKRVSFMLPEPQAGSCVPKASVLEDANKPAAEKNLDECNLKQSSLGNNAEQEGETVKSMAAEQNIRSRDEDNLEQEDHDTLSIERPVLKSSNLVEYSEADKMRRRSIADIQSKIKSLTKSSKSFPDSQTAPVSHLVGHLSLSSQAPTESSANKTEQAGTELSDKLSIDAKPNLYPKGDDVASYDNGETTLKETSLPNKLSVKVFHPKLPQKPNPIKCNVQESSSSSEAHVKPERSSLTLLKALTNCNTSQCIDEEFLPLSPDEKGQDGMFHYEVPEGAWEELFEKEALHCSLEQDIYIAESQDGINEKKRNREPEENIEFQKEKRGRTEDILNSDKSKPSVTITSPDDYHISEFSSLHLTKTIEQTNCSSNSSQDSRVDGMPMELSSSQQCSQMESQLPWDTGCEQSLWGKFQDGTITVKEFFMLLRIRILIQKPRYSELPANYRAKEAVTAEDLLLDKYIYQPKLQVYEEECHALGQIIQELKTFAEMQEKPLMQVNSLLWEAMKMCSEDEVIYFGVKLKSLKSSYSKKSKVLAHERKVAVYSKLLHVAQTRCEQLQSRMDEVDRFLEETDNCISELEREMDKLDEDIRNGELINMDPTVRGLQTELEKLQTEEANGIRGCLQLEERKEKVLTQLGCLQEEASKLDKQLEEFNFTEWDLDNWAENQAVFTFLYDSIELCIKFEDVVDGKHFVNNPCRRLSMVTFESQLNEEAAPPSSLLVHRLIMQFIEKNGCFHEKYKTQQDLPRLLFDLSLATSRCRLLGEEVEYLMKWGAKYNILKIQVESTEVKLLFSSSLAYAKFELIINLSESYPTLPLTFTFRNHIGNIGHSNISAVLSKVPVGLWYLKRAVRHIHQHLLV